MIDIFFEKTTYTVLLSVDTESFIWRIIYIHIYIYHVPFSYNYSLETYNGTPGNFEYPTFLMADTSYISMRSTCHVQTGNIDIKYTWYKSIEKIIIRLSNTLPQIKHFIHSLSWFFCKILSSNMFYWKLMIMIDRFINQAIWCSSQIV